MPPQSTFSERNTANHPARSTVFPHMSAIAFARFCNFLEGTLRFFKVLEGFHRMCRGSKRCSKGFIRFSKLLRSFCQVLFGAWRFRYILQRSARFHEVPSRSMRFHCVLLSVHKGRLGSTRFRKVPFNKGCVKALKRFLS